jgi:septation ring formation regulator EzrA
MSDERIKTLEMIADRHDRDLTLIASSIDKLVTQSEKTNEMIHNALLRDERFDSKLAKCEMSLSSRIEQLHNSTSNCHKRLDRFDSSISKLAWIVVTFAVLGILGAVVNFGVVV